MEPAKPYSDLRKAPRLALADAVPLPGPLSIHIEPTNVCNFKCVFCPESFDDFHEVSGGKFMLAPPDFDRVARQIKAMGTVKTINFYMMGEPFLNRNLCAYIRLAKDLGAAEKLIVTSNGSLLGQALWQPVLDSGLDYLRISIYGGDEGRQKSNTQAGVPLSRIQENIRGLKALRDGQGLAKPFIYVKMIESPDAAENQAFLERFRGVGDEVQLEPVMNWNDPVEGNLSKLSETELLEKPYFAKKKEKCPFPFYMLIINADLKVGICCVDWNKKTIIGDLNTQSLSEVWNGKALRDFQLAHLEGKRHSLDACAKCTYLHTAPDNLDALSAETFLARLPQA
ncbi:MAG TPA: radical SAM/SPASM domain-containing protein [bacterium]|nr:radical SAM/SPASM domain-containing protein [bacterium]